MFKAVAIVEWAITIWEAVQKCPILPSQYQKIFSEPKFILHFGGTNIIFTNCMMIFISNVLPKIAM